MKKLYPGNQPSTATEDELRQLFGQHGTVHSVAMINDRETGRPRGFGFVEVDDDAVQTMIQALDGKDMGDVHFRVPVTGGMFSASDGGEADFAPALDLGPADFVAVQAKMRHRGLHWLHRHGHLDDDALHALVRSFR